MPQVIHVATPLNFSFFHTILSHGWSDLPPFDLNENEKKLKYVFVDGGKPITAEITGSSGGLDVKLSLSVRNTTRIEQAVRHIFRFDDDLSGFYSMMSGHDGLRWAAEHNAGRLLRSPTVFEDLVKTLCTTNCSWSLTKKMAANLVEKLGVEGKDRRRAFPTPEALASVDVDFYRNEIRAGYRSPYFVELAEIVAAGKLDPESWLSSELPTIELKKDIKKVKGIGDYAAENLLKLLGRCDGLALDSWLRSQFYKKHNRGKVCADKKIEKHYAKFGKWKGLAIWCDMTQEWFAQKTAGV